MESESLTSNSYPYKYCNIGGHRCVSELQLPHLLNREKDSHNLQDFFGMLDEL